MQIREAMKNGNFNRVGRHFIVKWYITIFIIWLNWSRVKRSILIGSLSGPGILLYGPLRWTAHEVISLIRVLEKTFKKKHFGVK